MPGPRALRIQPPDGLALVVVIPEVKVFTDEARGAMPQQVPIADAANGISATAGLLLTLERGYLDEVPEFLMQDRLHEPFRGPLCPGLGALKALTTPGLLGVTVSGSGPSMLLWVEALKASDVAAAAREALAGAGVAAEVRVERVAPTGIRARWEGLEDTRLSRTPG